MRRASRQRTRGILIEFVMLKGTLDLDALSFGPALSAALPPHLVR
jgi:hypothetical protein